MISTSATAPTASSAIVDHPALGRKTQAATTPAISTIPATAGQNNAFQCGCRWISTCSSLVSTLSGKPTPTSCRHNVGCDGSGTPPVWGSADRPSASRLTARAGHHEAAGTVHIGRDTGQIPAARRGHPDLAPQGAAVHTVRLGQPAGPGVAVAVVPPPVPIGERAQQAAQQRVPVGARGAGQQQ